MDSFISNTLLPKNILWGNSLVVQWLRYWAFIARAQVQSLAGELRSRKLHGVAKKIINKQTNK